MVDLIHFLIQPWGTIPKFLWSVGGWQMSCSLGSAVSGEGERSDSGGKRPGRVASVAHLRASPESEEKQQPSQVRAQTTRWWSTEQQWPLNQECLTDPLAIEPSVLPSTVPCSTCAPFSEGRAGWDMIADNNEHGRNTISFVPIDDSLSSLGKSALGFIFYLF